MFHLNTNLVHLLCKITDRKPCPGFCREFVTGVSQHPSTALASLVGCSGSTQAWRQQSGGGWTWDTEGVLCGTSSEQLSGGWSFPTCSGVIYDCGEKGFSGRCSLNAMLLEVKPVALNYSQKLPNC